MKTVKVRIAVAVDPTGDWNATGCKAYDDKEAMMWAVEPLEVGERRFWVTAEVPIPEPAEIPGTVEPDSEGGE